MIKKQKEKKFLLYHLFGIVLLCFVVAIYIFNSTTAYFRDESLSSTPLDYLIIGGLSVSVEANFDYHHFALDPDTIYTKSHVPFTYKDENNQTQTIAEPPLCIRIVPDEDNALNHVLVRTKLVMSYWDYETNKEITTIKNERNEDEAIVLEDYLDLYFNSDRIINYDADNDGEEDVTTYNENTHLNKWYKVKDTAKGGYYYYFLGTIGRTGTVKDASNNNLNVPLTFSDGFKTRNNFTNKIKGKDIKMFLSVEVIQALEEAVDAEWVDNPLDATDETKIEIPALFKSFIASL